MYLISLRGIDIPKLSSIGVCTMSTVETPYCRSMDVPKMSEYRDIDVPKIFERYRCT